MADYQGTFMRVEKKYLLTRTQYDAFKKAIDGHMVYDRFGLHTICNLYFDTPDYLMIRRSLDKPVYKEKLRMRSYGVPGKDDTVFLEIKKKYKGIVYKRRVGMSLNDANAFLVRHKLDVEKFRERGGSEAQIAAEINWLARSYENLAPMAYIAYDRAALFSPENPDLRITFDANIRWRDDMLRLNSPATGEQVLPEGMTLMEIKIPGAVPLWLNHILTELGIFSSTFSKYGASYKNFVLPRQLCMQKGRIYGA